jgi:hypothetical protein
VGLAELLGLDQVQLLWMLGGLVVEAAGWRSVRLERLRDVEWARAMVLPPLERMLGVTPEFAIIADDTAGP